MAAAAGCTCAGKGGEGVSDVRPHDVRRVRERVAGRSGVYLSAGELCWAVWSGGWLWKFYDDHGEALRHYARIRGRA